jgi:thioredoxin-related protein
MKKYFLIVGILLSISQTILYAETLHSDSNSSSKITMIFITQTGCPACERIKEMMQYGKFKEILQKHFKITKLDISEIETLPKNLEQPIGTPTIYFLNTQGKEVIEWMVGGKSEDNFMDTLKEAIEANK